VLIQNDRFNTLPTHDIDAEDEDDNSIAETFGKRHFDLYLDAKRMTSLQPELPTAMRYSSYTKALGTNINSFILKNKVLGRITILGKMSSSERMAGGVIAKELSRLDQLQTTSNKLATEDTKAEETTRFISRFESDNLPTKQSQSRGLEFSDSNSRLTKPLLTTSETTNSFRMVRLTSKQSSSKSLKKNRNKESNPVFNHYYIPSLLTTNDYWIRKKAPSVTERFEGSQANPLETRTLKRLKTQNSRGKKKVTECKVDCDDYFKEFICKSFDAPRETSAADMRASGLLSFDE